MVYVPGRKPKPTHVAWQFGAKKPGPTLRVLDRIPNRPAIRVPVLRLAFASMTPKIDITIKQLRDFLVDGSQRDAILFPDAGIITTRIPPVFWEAAAACSLAFTQMTIAELSGWLSTPFCNQY